MHMFSGHSVSPTYCTLQTSHMMTYLYNKKCDLQLMVFRMSVLLDGVRYDVNCIGVHVLHCLSPQGEQLILSDASTGLIFDLTKRLWSESLAMLITCSWPVVVNDLTNFR